MRQFGKTQEGVSSLSEDYLVLLAPLWDRTGGISVAHAMQQHAAEILLLLL